MEERKETRGAKKGRPKPEGSGRKATGRVRDKNISFRVSEEEKQFIYDTLDKLEKDRTTAIIEIFEYYNKNKL